MTSYRPIMIDRQIDQILDEALRTIGSSGDWTPMCNVWDDENGFYVQLAVPGWEASQVSLEVNDQVLTMKGERPEAAADGRYHLREIGGTSFSRRIKLPAFVDQNKARATYTNGLMTLTFPKREEAKPRRILIES